jgi:glycerophosphoryl diester phosphodiesterase
MQQTLEAVHRALRHSRARLRAAAACSLAFKALNLALLTPLAAAGVRMMMQRWGRASVGNFEIAAFLLSLPGLVALVGTGSLVFATQYLESAALMRLLADRRLPWWHALGGATGVFHRLLLLGMRQFGAYLLLSLPFLVAIGVIYRWLWAGRDLNGLLVLKPPVFWMGAGLAAAVAAVYVVLALRLFLRWLFAVPVVLFEPPLAPRNALRRSTELTRGRLRRLGTAIVLWAAIQALLSAVAIGLFKVVSAWVLAHSGSSLPTALPVTAVLLLLNALLLTQVSVFGSATFAALVLGLYRQAAGVETTTADDSHAEVATTPLPQRWLVPAGLLTLGVIAVVVSGRLLSRLQLEDPVEITAHRAGALRAPENTVAAIRQAIADGADWAEIDVQRTADDVLVVLHDIDLARIGGGNRRVDQVTLAEIQALDVGTLFGPQFAGEQVPTFDAILAAAGDTLRLNVELKPHSAGDAGPLTERTVAAIQRAGLVERCRICSQSYDSLQLSRRLEPRLKVGFIAAVAVGDLAQLDVDFLMVSADRAQRKLVDRAAARNIAVHAWTVNDAALVAPLVDQGVANLITDDPVLIRARLDEVRALSPTERLLLRVRNELLH